MKKLILLFIAFLASVTIFRLTQIGKLQLAADEAYFWEWSRHLDISYHDQGPILGLAIFLSTQLLGKISEFSVRLPSVIFALGTIIFVYLLAKNIFQNIYSGLLSAIFLQVIPITAVGGMLITADIPMVFFWTLSLYFLYKAVFQEKSICWYLAGISSALGIMSKYTMVFFSGSVFLFLLFSRKQRRWFLRKEPYIALGLSLIGFLPTLIWNIKNNFLTYGYIRSLFFSGEYSYPGIQGLKGVLEYTGGQLGVVSPFIGLFFIYLIIFLSREGFKKKNDDFLFLFWTSLTVLLVFGVISFFSSVEENWPVPAYISLSIAGGGFLSSDFFKNFKYKTIISRYAVFAFSFGFLLTALLHLHALYKIFPLAVHMDPTDKLRGWKELGKEVTALMKESPAHTFVLSNYFGTASELAFYIEGQPEIRCVDTGQRIRQYRLWSKFDSLAGDDAVYVSRDPEAEPIVKSIFHSVELEKTIPIYRDGQRIRTFYLYRCKKFKGNYELPKSPTLF